MDGLDDTDSTTQGRPVIIVTGSSDGIGAAIGRHCLASGWRVVFNSRTAKPDLSEFVAGRSDALYVLGDATRDEDCQRLVDAALEQWGRLDALVNNAGMTARIPHEDVSAVTPDLFTRILEVNVVGPWRMIGAALPALRAATPGSIVNIASVAGLRPVGSSLPYAVSKAALIHLTQLLAKAVGPDVRVNAIAPGLVSTEWTADWGPAHAAVASMAPLRRSGLPEDVAKACDYLLAAPYVTGDCLVVDGGMRLVM
jgi:ketoreductase RED2